MTVKQIGSKVREVLQDTLDSNPEAVLLAWKDTEGVWHTAAARVSDGNTTFPFLEMIGQCEYLKSFLVLEYSDMVEEHTE